MSLTDSLSVDTQRGQGLRVALVLGLFLAGLGALYLRVETVNPAEDFAYRQQLRDLSELDALIDRELLANRLELVRNYDGLTAYTQRALATSSHALQAPSFLAAADLANTQDAAQALSEILGQKAALIDHFKRDNAILRNSLAYFPVAVGELFGDRSGATNGVKPVHRQVDRYVLDVLAFARAPSKIGRANSREAGEGLRALRFEDSQQRQVDNVLQHGDVIIERLLALDQLSREIFQLGSNTRIEALSQRYSEAQARALAIAERFRMLLYAVAGGLAAYLAWTFSRLELTRRSLEASHRELNNRYVLQLAAEKQLKLHATAFLSAHDGISLTDHAGNILDVNPAFSRITGWERNEVIGRNPRVLKSGRHDSEFYSAMWKSIRETGNWSGEVWNRNKYGDIYPELLSISAVHDEAGQLTNYVAVFADIGRIKAQEKQLVQMAYYDALTDLPNRSLLGDRLIQGILQTRRTGKLMAVCYLDLDGFKQINDTWGHEAGDKALVGMATRLKDALRGGDTVARLGGDEFALLLLGVESTAQFDDTLCRLLEQIAQPLLILPEAITLSASIGVTLFPLDDDDPDTLLRHADQAMYQAKQAGKNCYHIFDPEQDRSARSRHDRVARIRQALENNEFLLYYQPKVDMRRGRVVGAEALIRWNHPERGILPPLDFLPLIEDDELIKPVGDWVLENALQQIEIWQDAGLELTVSVNIAARQLQAPEFVEKLKVALFLHPRAAGRLELEILETAALKDVVKTSRVINECQALGVHFSLDDFGTGYSSLTYLKRLPAETIKIDQSFVREILNDYNNLVIVQGVIGLANAFERQIIAEGVETAEHGRLLLQLNCDFAQGYGIAKPLPAHQVLDWVRNWRPDPLWASVAQLEWDAGDYPMLLAEVQLRNWVAQLVYAVNEGLPAPQRNVGDAHCCGFGIWYRGRGCERYADQATFALIEEPHSRVHRIAAEMNEHWRNGEIKLSLARVPQLLAARDDTQAALRLLQLAVGTPRAVV